MLPPSQCSCYCVLLFCILQDKNWFCQYLAQFTTQRLVRAVLCSGVCSVKKDTSHSITHWPPLAARLDIMSLTLVHIKTSGSAPRDLNSVTHRLTLHPLISPCRCLPNEQVCISVSTMMEQTIWVRCPSYLQDDSPSLQRTLRLLTPYVLHLHCTEI